ncbi:uncharacterized protein BX664DRAFT_333789 [Halteromyces radiatus]|uniref:uncharacterized protein n=1 Tax=Halteromyces radiatus TaxID=101107 RepID=UPI00222087C7|nr:uncharacterized protein BX664DRAFT_333789 [Halteromyces radiatus]KAI8089743.1 hypothetical protein BX664DRAFT_333789 [Halteromyces radiatus]
MDVVLKYADDYVFDSFYNKMLSISVLNNATTSGMASDLMVSSWTQDNVYRQFLTVFIIVCSGGWFFYLAAACLSYYFIFDHEMMKHPKFLKNQVRQEIICAVSAIPGFSILTVPWFVGEVRGYSLLYEGTPQTTQEWLYLIATIPAFLFITDMGIYWIHRFLHHPLLYKPLHKLHHKWIVPSPFASHAFHPLDGYLQSTPYHLYAYLVPMHKWLYMGMFIFVNVWTVLIHDGNFFSHSDIINTTAHHTVHHLYFNYNYGQYFTFWDKLGGSHRQPTAEQYDAALRNNKSVWAAQSKDADTIEREDEVKAQKYKQY